MTTSNRGSVKEMAVLSKAAKETRQWFGRHRPHVAKSILYVEKLFGALDGIPGLDSIKIATLSCSAFRGVLMKWHDKRVQEAEAALADVHLVEEMTPQQLQYLELINASNSVIMDQLEEKFAELKEDIGQVKVVVDEILENITEMRHTKGIERIHATFYNMLSNQNKENLEEWAANFRFNVSSFEETLHDFNKENVRSYLLKIYQTKCADSLEPLHKAFKLFLDTRQLYTLIKMVYYKYLPSQVLHDIPTLKPEERSMDEFEEGEKAIELIKEDVEFVMKGFYTACVAAKPEWKQKLKLSYCPDFDDIKKSKENSVKRNVRIRRLQYGSGIESMIPGNFNVYRNKAISGFLLVHDTSNDREEIYKADEKNLKLKSGIFKAKFTDGEIHYGTRVFDKSDASGEENKLWFLVKFTDGDIHYQESIMVCGQDDDWRTITGYKFDPTSLEWKKIQ